MNFLNPAQWFLVVVFGLLFLVVNGWPVVSWAISAVRNIKLPAAVATASAPVGDDEFQDMLALHRLEARFERLKCAAGQAAMKTAGEHFFHKQGDDKPA